MFSQRTLVNNYQPIKDVVKRIIEDYKGANEKAKLEAFSFLAMFQNSQQDNILQLMWLAEEAVGDAFTLSPHKGRLNLSDTIGDNIRELIRLHTHKLQDTKPNEESYFIHQIAGSVLEYVISNPKREFARQKAALDFLSNFIKLSKSKSSPNQLIHDLMGFFIKGKEATQCEQLTRDVRSFVINYFGQLSDLKVLENRTMQLFAEYLMNPETLSTKERAEYVYSKLGTLLPIFNDKKMLMARISHNAQVSKFDFTQLKELLNSHLDEEKALLWCLALDLTFDEKLREGNRFPKLAAKFIQDEVARKNLSSKPLEKLTNAVLIYFGSISDKSGEAELRGLSYLQQLLLMPAAMRQSIEANFKFVEKQTENMLNELAICKTVIEVVNHIYGRRTGEKNPLGSSSLLRGELERSVLSILNITQDMLNKKVTELDDAPINLTPDTDYATAWAVRHRYNVIHAKELLILEALKKSPYRDLDDVALSRKEVVQQDVVDPDFNAKKFKHKLINSKASAAKEFMKNTNAPYDIQWTQDPAEAKQGTQWQYRDEEAFEATPPFFFKYDSLFARNKAHESQESDDDLLIMSPRMGNSNSND